MAKIRNVSDGPLEVRLSTGFTATVDPDSVLEVPDEEYDAHSWAESLWSLVTPAKKSPAKSDEELSS